MHLVGKEVEQVLLTQDMMPARVQAPSIWHTRGLPESHCRRREALMASPGHLPPGPLHTVPRPAQGLAPAAAHTCPPYRMKDFTFLGGFAPGSLGHPQVEPMIEAQ